MHALEEIQIDADCLFVQSFIVNSWLADPVLRLSLQKHAEKVPQNFVADDFLDEFIVVFFPFQQFVVDVDALSDPYPFHSFNFVWFEVGEKALADIFGDVFGVS